MKSANQWLLENGFIEKITRGRRSVENIQRLNEAYAAGTRFTDWEPKETTNASGEKVITNGSAKPNNLENYGEPFIRYPGPTGNEVNANSVWAVKVNGKALPTPNDYGGLRTICFNCGLSLVGHMCNNPQIMHDGKAVAVTIERR